MFLYLAATMMMALAASGAPNVEEMLTPTYEDNWADSYKDTDKEAVLQQENTRENDMVQSDQELDKNSFFIYNKVYERAALAQQGTEAITHEPFMYADQIWMLEESTTYPGYYYIHNAYNDGYRLALKGINPVVYNGYYYENQLWRLQKEGDYYRIFNKYHPASKLAKNGRGDHDLTGYSGPDYDDQLWKLVPRFSVTESEKVIWSIDNREGTNPVTKSFKVITGVKLSRSQTLSTRIGFEQSLKASVAGLDFSSTFSAEIENSVTDSEERFWAKETVTTFTAPAGKSYRVLQTLLNFSSPYEVDDCFLYSHERIEEQ